MVKVVKTAVKTRIVKSSTNKLSWEKKDNNQIVELVHLPLDVFINGIFQYLTDDELFWSLGLCCKRFMKAVLSIIRTINLKLDNKSQDDFDVMDKVFKSKFDLLSTAGIENARKLFGRHSTLSICLQSAKENNAVFTDVSVKKIRIILDMSIAFWSDTLFDYVITRFNFLSSICLNVHPNLSYRGIFCALRKLPILSCVVLKRIYDNVSAPVFNVNEENHDILMHNIAKNVIRLSRFTIRCNWKITDQTLNSIAQFCGNMKFLTINLPLNKLKYSEEAVHRLRWKCSKLEKFTIDNTNLLSSKLPALDCKFENFRLKEEKSFIDTDTSMNLSTDLQRIIPRKMASYNECLEYIWKYVIEKLLHKNSNKMFFKPNETLRKMFGNDELDGFSLGEKLRKQLSMLCNPNETHMNEELRGPPRRSKR